MKTVILQNAALFAIHEEKIDLATFPDVIFYKDVAYVRFGVQGIRGTYREASVFAI